MPRQRRASTLSAPTTRNASSGTFAGNYNVGEELGEGAFAVVKECFHKETGKSYAVKIISQVARSEEAKLKDEIRILIKLKHPNIVTLSDVFRDNGYYYLVMEKMHGGELFDRIVAKEYYNEEEARDICVSLFDAMRYCHKKRIVHRDLKPENLLLASPDSDTDIKIVDFGFAKQVDATGKSLSTMIGTPGYIAPEVIKGKKYGVEVDMWSLGVIVYIILGGYAPFEEEDQYTLYEKISEGDYEFHEQFWGHVSQDAQDLISGMLTVKRKHRITADEALRNRWMLGNGRALSTRNLSINLQQFVRFNAKRKFKGATLAVIAANRVALPPRMPAKPLPSPEQTAKPSIVISSVKKIAVSSPHRTRASAAISLAATRAA